MPDKFFLVRLSAPLSVPDLHALLWTSISSKSHAIFFLVISAILVIPGLAVSSTRIQPKNDQPVYEAGQTQANFLPSNHSNATDAITRALNDLDSPVFKNREKAIQELVELGEPAIEALALRSLDCTPETCLLYTSPSPRD